jgi:hypothetical protein
MIPLSKLPTKGMQVLKLLVSSIRHFFSIRPPSLIFRNTYGKVAGKYQDVLTLEASVAELHQMFLDFALLTEQQGELLDQIEFQVTSAADYVEEANEEVVEAIEISKKVRKKQWYVSIPLFSEEDAIQRSNLFLCLLVSQYYYSYRHGVGYYRRRVAHFQFLLRPQLLAYKVRTSI